ncbi:MAG: hypothetical protein ACLU6B_00900 [Lachnospirales bacterium]
MQEKNTSLSLFCHWMQAILALTLFIGSVILQYFHSPWVPIGMSLLTEESFHLMDILNQWLHFLH